MPWGAAAGVAGSLISSSISAGAAGDAAQAQTNASNNALGLQKQVYGQQQSNLAPYMNSGVAANAQLSKLLGLSDNTAVSTAEGMGPQYQSVVQPIYQQFGVTGPGQSDAADAAALTYYMQQRQATNASDPSYGSLTKPITMQDVQADPVYASGLDFGLNQGTSAINNRALSQGGYDSGATLKALTRFASDYGTTKAQAGVSDIQSNRNQQYGFLSGAAGMGMNAVSGSNAAGTSFGNSASNLITGAGNAQAAGIVGGANAYSGLGSSIGNAYNQYQNGQLLSSLVGNNNGGGVNDPGYAGGMSYMNSQLSGVTG